MVRPAPYLRASIPGLKRAQDPGGVAEPARQLDELLSTRGVEGLASGHWMRGQVVVTSHCQAPAVQTTRRQCGAEGGLNLAYGGAMQGYALADSAVEQDD